MLAPEFFGPCACARDMKYRVDGHNGVKYMSTHPSVTCASTFSHLAAARCPATLGSDGSHGTAESIAGNDTLGLV